MIITKMSLPRRTVLRGLGTAVALPLLDAMVPAATALARTVAVGVKRFGAVYIPNGANMVTWTPTEVGSRFDLPLGLGPMAPFKDRLVVLSGLANRQADPFGDGNGDHARAQTVFLNGVHPKRTEGADVRASTTADQVAARSLGRETALPSLELALEGHSGVGNCENGYSCIYTNTFSWRTPTAPNPMEMNPRVVFERLFGDGGTAAQRLERMEEDRSILDQVTGDMNRLRRSVGAGDLARIDQYLDSVREIERRIQRAESQASTSALPEVLERPVGVPMKYDDHARMMFDLQALALQADITRVFTFLMSREATGNTYDGLAPNGHHSTSHHQNAAVNLNTLTKVNVFHLSLFAGFLERLQAVPEGDGSILDNSMIVYGGGISDPNQHSHVDVPVFVVGGGAGRLKGGRHLRYPKETPLTNAYVTLLEKLDIAVGTFGDSTGRLTDL